jgi:2',3'-cyclic-nucleotide 2'-phosphodiesterase (5'-nucleotidase family)
VGSHASRGYWINFVISTAIFLYVTTEITFHGTRPVVATEGTCMVPILNRLGLAAMTGHWDFAYGPEVLQKRVNERCFDSPIASWSSSGSGSAGGNARNRYLSE